MFHVEQFLLRWPSPLREGRACPSFLVPKLRHLLGRKRLIMKGLGRRNGAFGPIMEMAIPLNDRGCWFGDGVSCASDFHLRFYGRFADLHKLHALHVRLSRSCAQDQWPYGENRIGRHYEGTQRSQGSRVVSLNSSRPGAGVGQFMRFFSTEGAWSRVIVREFEKRRFPVRFTFGAAASQS